MAAGLASVAGVGAQTAGEKAQRVRESIAAYSGACPCPYSVMANGRRCGARSAYSRPGGRAPLCYPQDVTAAEAPRRR